jgi:hypothetical protein
MQPIIRFSLRVCDGNNENVTLCCIGEYLVRKVVQHRSAMSFSHFRELKGSVCNTVQKSFEFAPKPVGQFVVLFAISFEDIKFFETCRRMKTNAHELAIPLPFSFNVFPRNRLNLARFDFFTPAM